jgi:hypothetical protein
MKYFNEVVEKAQEVSEYFLALQDVVHRSSVMNPNITLRQAISLFEGPSPTVKAKSFEGIGTKLLATPTPVTKQPAAPKTNRSEKFQGIVRRRVLTFLRKHPGQKFNAAQLGQLAIGDHGTIAAQVKSLAARGVIKSQVVDGRRNRFLYWAA